MRINTLSVTNFKDIQQVDFKLNDKITVFAGGISTVNTNLLDALAIALESFSWGFLEYMLQAFKNLMLEENICHHNTQLLSRLVARYVVTKM